MKTRFLLAGALAFFLLCPGLALSAVDDVRITEFAAVNDGPLTDEDGEFSDWIEIHNAGTNVVNLDGWTLTDNAADLDRWRFPATNLAPNTYLVVFASDKDRRVPGAPLHTNFRLGGGGEYLALVRPDGTNIASAYSPEFPPQVASVSYGIPLAQRVTALVPAGATARVLVPGGSLGPAWSGLMFDDSSWTTAVTGVGYEADTQAPFVPVTIANSAGEFSGTQGQNNWSYGYWNRKTDADGQYAHTEFVSFPNAGGGWSANNFWTGTAWDWFNGDPPFTQLTAQGGWPTASGGLAALADHWAVRRYICESNGPVKITGRITHTSDWVYVTQTGVASSSLLYLYLLGPGEGYIDDLKLVAGVTPEAGANLIANGDFENNLTPAWNVEANLAGSSVTTAVRHSGNRSLKLVSTDAGSTQTSSIWQLLNPSVPSGQIFTLSYWYLPATNSAPLIARFSGSWIETTPEYCGDGTVARIFVDGTEVLAETARVSSMDYSVTVPAQAGSRIDFAIDPGLNFDGQCDGTIFTATVRTEDPNVTVVADSEADWSFSGTQGENSWFNGYYDKTADTNAVPINTYHAGDFVLFPRNDGPFGPNNFWDGRAWDWWNGDPPTDEIGQLVMNPTGLNNNVEHWVIRRWVGEVSGSITVDWSLNKIESSGAGLTMRVFQNGIQRDSVTLPGTNYSILKRSFVINNVQQGDFIDIAMDPQGFGGGFGDGGDRSLVSVVIRGRSSLTSEIAGDIESSLRGANATAYIRLPFNVPDPAAIEFLTLRMKYDDGFVAYLNGVPVASANAPQDPAWNSAATSTRSDADARQFQDFNLTPVRGLLQMGANVLAIQGLNASASDSDFLVLPELLATSITLDPAAPRYFPAQTPGAANGYGSTNVGPVIRDAGHTPGVPRDDQNLVVTASVRPTFNPIGSVRLIYRVMYSNEVATAMFDDGSHGDGAAGDGVFGGTIPASASMPGQMVRYSIAASDIATNESRFPAFEDPKNSPQYQGTVVLDLSQTNPLPVLHWFVQNPVLATNEVGTRCSIFYDGEFYDNVGVNLHGQTTAFVFPKRSMNIDLNPGHRFRWSRDEERVDDFNLLTPIADKAYVRQILAWETFVNAGVPAHFAFPVRVQQNNAFFGVFHFVERGDDHFLDRLGLDPEGALYKVYLPLTDAYGGVAEKKTRRSEPNDDLQALIDGCNLTGPPGRRYLYDNVDVPEVINFLATLQLVQNEDCCFFKNYYLYRDTAGTGLWQMLPWDLDLVFGRTFNFFVLSNQTVNGYFDTNIYWTNSYEAYNQQRANTGFIGLDQPVADAIFSSPETLDMFYRRWTSVQEEFLQRTNTHPYALKFERRIDELAAQIGPDAALDFARWGNWFPQQTMPVAVQILKTEYFARRRGWIFNTLAFANGGPYLGPQPTNAVVLFGAIEFNPSSGNQAQEYIQLTNANTYAVDLSGWRLRGAVDYTFRPGVVLPPRGALYVSPDQKAFRARSSGPRGGQGLFVQGDYRGQLSARGEGLELIDRNGRVVRGTNYAGSPSLAQQFLRITELMYHPEPSSGSITNGDDFEYIELKNTGTTALSLAGVRLVNGVEFSFAGSAVTSLAGGESVLVVRNLAAFVSRYGAGLNIAGQFTGALDNGGENVRLDDATGEKILDFDYDNAWYPITDGNGFSLVIVDENAAWDSWGLKSSWRPAGVSAGSPGQVDPPPPAMAPIVVNEVLTHTDPPTVDAIELFNPTASAVNIGGWYLSDDFLTPRKFRIPDGTTIPEGGYLVFTEADFNPTNPATAASFSFSSKGDEAYLFSADGAGNLTGYFHGHDFGAAENAVSFGRHVTSLGEEHFVAQSASTLGGLNAGPKVGPVVISEIMFHPPDFPGGEDNQIDEFIELQNNTAGPVALFDPAHPANTWRLRGAAQFDFPAAATLPANSHALVVSFDPADATILAAFRARYGVPAGIPIFGPYLGKLDNSDERIELYKPDPPDTGEVPFVLVDSIDYQSSAPWPAGADGSGASLQRRSVAAYGNDPASWAAGAATPGRPFTGGTPPVITLQPASQTVVAFMNAAFHVAVSGTAPIEYQWQLNGTNVPGATNMTFVVPRVQPLSTGVVAVTVFNGAGAVISSNATFSTLLPAYIARHPTNSLVRVAPDPAAPANPTASFNIGAVSPTPIRYQWRFNGVDLPGATNATLTLTNVQIANEGSYTAVAIDSVGAVESNPALLIPLVSPVIVQGPVPQSVPVGGVVTLSVVATGRPLPFSFEWRRGSSPIASDTVYSGLGFYSFVATNVPMTNAYRVIVRNLANQGTTANAVANVVTLVDADADGLPDAWEAAYGLSPSDASDAGLDGDGDGMSNGAEFVAGTDPADSSSYLRIESIAADGDATIGFSAASGRTYSVEFTDALLGGGWQKLADVAGRTNARVELITDAGYTTNRFYRLVVPKQP